MFLLAGLEHQPLQFNVKCNPEKALELRAQFPDSILPGYHMSKKNWNTIIVDGKLSVKQMQSFIDESYELINNSRK